MIALRLLTSGSLMLACVLVPATEAHAEGGLFRSKNGDVERGNERLAKNDAKGALEAYDRAARSLPGEGAVHLNRGLALLAQGDLDAAREALRLATDPPASPAVRADAYYDLGIAFYRQGEANLAEQKQEEAQQAFREASDAFRKALRQRPGDANTAWNYELAQRRIVELKKEQEKQEQEQKQDDQQQDQQQQDQQDQDQQDQDQQQQDQQKQDQQDQQKQDQQAQDQQQQQDQQKQQQQQDQQEQDQAQPTEPETADQKLPKNVAQALDALDQGEKNLQRERAMQRAAQRRPPAKDW